MNSTSIQCAKPRAVLTKEQAIDIFRLSTFNYSKASRPTATSVAKAFGVSEKTIRDIWNGRTWCEETLPLDSSRQPKPRKKAGRPLGRKDSAPRRPKGGSKREIMPQDSRPVSEGSPQTLLISRRKAKSEDGASLISMGATTLLPDHSLPKVQFLEYDSLPSNHFDRCPWKREFIPTSLHPFRNSASIDGSALLTARPWQVLTLPGAGNPSNSAPCWPAASSRTCWHAAEYNAGFYAAHGQSLQQNRLSLALLPESAEAAPASLLSLDPALYAPRLPSLASPPAAFWNLAAALPLHRAAQPAGASAADHAMSAAAPRSRFG